MHMRACTIMHMRTYTKRNRMISAPFINTKKSKRY